MSDPDETAAADQTGSRRFMEFVLRLREAGVLAFLALLGALFATLTSTFLTTQV